MSAPRSPFRPVFLLLPVMLAGCGGGPAPNAPACPKVALLADAADLSRYRGTGRDLTDLVLTGRVTAVSGKCTRESATALRAEVSVKLDVGRGPAAAGRTAELSYFIAATRGDQILDKQVFPVRAVFPANTDTLSLTGDPVVLTLPTPSGVKGSDYRLLVGFQLAPAELATNRLRAGTH